LAGIADRYDDADQLIARLQGLAIVTALAERTMHAFWRS
jgi:hypothetical protein